MVRLPKKNLEEAQRLLGCLQRSLEELGRKAEAVQIEAIKKQLKSE